MPIELILSEDVAKLGDAGDIVRVKAGYARNYLLPQGKAMLATKGRVKELEHQRRVIDEKVKKEMKTHAAAAKRLNDTKLSFIVKAGEEGKLFGSVTSQDIHAELQSKGIELDRRKIELDEPIKQLGEYDVKIRLHREVNAEVHVTVAAEEE